MPASQKRLKPALQRQPKARKQQLEVLSNFGDTPRYDQVRTRVDRRRHSRSKKHKGEANASPLCNTLLE